MKLSEQLQGNNTSFTCGEVYICRECVVFETKMEYCHQGVIVFLKVNLISIASYKCRNQFFVRCFCNLSLKMLPPYWNRHNLRIVFSTQFKGHSHPHGAIGMHNLFVCLFVCLFFVCLFVCSFVRSFV